MKKTILIKLSLILMLSGCTATQLSKNKVYDSTSDDGLVVIGVKSTSGPYSLIFAKLFEGTCKPDVDLGLGTKNFTDNMFGTPFKEPYIIDTFSPGVWVVYYSSYEPSPTQRINVNYNSGTVAFDVKPGEFISIDKLIISTSSAGMSDATPELLEQFLEKYPNIKVAPKAVNPWITAYGKDAADTRVGCVPIRPAETTD